MRKALGRCKHGHVMVVEYPADAKTMPAVLCDKGGHPLEEWAVRYPATPA